MVTLVVAYNKNFVIGDSQGNIPWHLPEDLRFFKEVTMGKPCIMGRKTWESLPDRFKPLPGRKNIIVTRNNDSFFQHNTRYVLCDNPIYIASTLELALAKAKKYSDDACVIGGGEIYKYCIDNNLVDRVLASEVHGYLDIQGKTYFPNLTELGWHGETYQMFETFTVVDYRCLNPKE
jgi:dihydrofolate reductase